MPFLAQCSLGWPTFPSRARSYAPHFSLTFVHVGSMPGLLILSTDDKTGAHRGKANCPRSCLWFRDR